MCRGFAESGPPIQESTYPECMATASLHAAAEGDRAAWKALVHEYAPAVWQTASSIPDFGRAVDAGQVVFLRLADLSGELSDADLDDWVPSTLDEVRREAESAQWRAPVPAFRQFDGVPDPLLEAATRAIDLRIAGVPVARPLFDSATGVDERPAEARGVTVAWRGDQDGTAIPVPEAVWRGSYSFDDVTIDLTLLASDERRLVGVAPQLSGGTVRLRPDAGDLAIDATGRFRLTDVPEAPTSIELRGPSGTIVTEWRIL